MKVKVAIIGELDDTLFDQFQKDISEASKLFDYYSENWEYKRGKEK